MRGLLSIFDRPDRYELEVRVVMARMGAKKPDYQSLTPELIWENFVAHKDPENVALKIMSEGKEG